MANRFITYGYCLDKGQLIVSNNEAKVVRYIFNQYADGISLRTLVEKLNEDKVEYSEGKCEWNKRRISRILQNEKYIGADNHPAIISSEIFQKANQLIILKGYKKKPCAPEIEYLKKIVYCGQCGKLLHRRSMWDTREKWICHSDCKCKRYIADEDIIAAVLNAIEKIKENPQILSRDEEETSYFRTNEIMRYTNEISRITNSLNPSFNTGKKLIFECANLKFQACREKKGLAYTDRVLQLTKEQDIDNKIESDYLEKAVSKIVVDADGTTTVRFINGSEIKDREENNAGTSEKNRNKNRRQSVTCKAK